MIALHQADKRRPEEIGAQKKIILVNREESRKNAKSGNIIIRKVKNDEKQPDA
ncbi:hypothetical protein [Holdemania filiformis]|uniref:hypothetical protein n=1 Tax=Holdemania filiformis TaxID=61171 RepID=UPI0002E1A16A|nr:hypothetical protein [Holdemania filiformis]MCQ4951653.1 hypothetical protein [Holdemania filiformis]